MTVRRLLARLPPLTPPRAAIDWRIESLAATMILAEAAIVYVYVGALLPGRAAPFSPFPALLLAALLLAGYALPRLLEALYVRSSAYEIVVGVAVCLSLLLAARLAMFPSAPWLDSDWVSGFARSLIFRSSEAERPAWGVVAVVGYAWWRGRTRGEPSLESTYELLRWGSLLLAGGLLLALIASPPEGAIRSRLPAAVLWFVTAALAGIALARLRLEALRSSGPLGGSWLLAVLGALAGVVLLAVVIAGIVNRQVLELLWLILWPVLWVIGLMLRVIVLLLALLTFILILPILWFLERQGLGRSLVGGRAGWLLEPLSRLHDVARLQIEVADPVRYLLAGLVLATIVSWLVRWVYRRRRRWRVPTPEERELALEGPPSLDGLRRRLHRILRRRPGRPDPLDALRGDPRWRYTLRIRLAYRQLLRQAGRVGLGRRPAQTPQEYERLLVECLPEVAGPLDELTRLYQAARYRPAPAGPEEAESAQRALTTALAALRRPSSPLDALDPRQRE